MLSEIGYKFDGEQVTDFEVQYLTLVGATLNECRERDLKKKKGLNRSRKK